MYSVPGILALEDVEATPFKSQLSQVDGLDLPTTVKLKSWQEAGHLT
eukprot:CAMPEP_0206607946 /NCGR_PEP_ID=MMETSP0325_2-20121206/52583_1 /ASSEMBLY_ACC=CAM_ASM_000347 /TAXON_ID=2866 /ORGANISM="Crypthecodinium cohnii, Strain Seligo" /LENGTH=46 /DNA_ID= /DNA_START= /DNA_END= /DNA_ORIENTATION=